ncbi:hypothetical protein ACS0TY_011127 [Phlomoides rotata]
MSMEASQPPTNLSWKKRQSVSAVVVGEEIFVADSRATTENIQGRGRRRNFKAEDDLVLIAYKCGVPAKVRIFCGLQYSKWKASLRVSIESFGVVYSGVVVPKNANVDDSVQSKGSRRALQIDKRFKEKVILKKVDSLHHKQYCSSDYLLLIYTIARMLSVTDHFVSELVKVCGRSIRELDLANCTQLTDCSLKTIVGSCADLCSVNLSYLHNLLGLGMEYLANGC